MSSDRERVLLIGQGVTALSALESLDACFDVVGLVRSADSGDPVVRLAAESDAALITDTTPSSVRSAVAELNPDAVVVSSYDRILPSDLVQHRPFVNVHYAPLPRYRGRATVNWAIINNESEAWISIHSLVAGLDSGGILYQQSIPIGPRATVTDLYEELNAIQRKVLASAVERRLKGDEGTPQHEASATYTCSRVPDDGEVDWSAPTAAIDRLVRALTDPFPGAFTWLGLERLTILRAEPLIHAPNYEGRIPGRVVQIDRSRGAVDVLTGDGVLRIHLIRLGNDIMHAADLIRSVRQTLGLSVCDVMRELDEIKRAVGSDSS